MAVAMDPRLLQQLVAAGQIPEDQAAILLMEEQPSAEQQVIEAQMANQVPDITTQDLSADYATQAAALNAPQKPQEMKTMSELEQAAMKLKGYSAARENEIKQLKQYMQDYAQMDQGVDLRPLAAWAAGLTGNQGLYQAAQATAPESKAERARNLIEQQQKLTNLVGEQDQAKSLMELYRQQQRDQFFGKKQDMEQQRLDLQRARTEKQLGQLDESNIQKFEKSVQGKAALDASIKTLEKYLGFGVDQYDPTTNTANGKSVDLPGVNIPVAGRVGFYDKRARQIDDAMARIFNVELRDRSGAAVTNQELDRLKGEFSSGQFQTEPEKLQAIQDYKNLLDEELQRRSAAFSPEVRSTYQERLKDIKKSTPVKKGQMSFEEWKKQKGVK